MTQVADYSIPGAPLTMATLAETIEDALEAAVSANRGATAPTNPIEGMFWWDTATAPIEILKRYTVDSGWIELLSISTATGAVVTIAGLTIGGTGTGDIVVQSQLGTGATATMQTSTTDDTPGSLLIYGAFGVGKAVVYGGNLNSLTADGVYFVVAGATNIPSGEVSGWCTVRSYTENYIKQIYEPHNSNEVYFRRKQVTWGIWAKVIG